MFLEKMEITKSFFWKNDEKLAHLRILAPKISHVEEALIGSIVSPILMLGICHRGDWLKEIFGLAQSMVGWYVEFPLVGFFIW